MRDKLLNYGFQDWQIEKLMKDKELDTVHGVYTLEGETLFLTQDEETKKVHL